MFKLYRNLSKRDWLCVVLIIALTVLQVYLTMTIVDYVQGIIKSITYLNYHNNPLSMGEGLATLVSNFGWESLKNLEFLAGLGIEGEAANMLVSVATASTRDIWFYGGVMIAFAAGIMVVQAMISLLASRVAADLSTNIRKKVYYKVESFSLAEINKFSTPSLITRTTNDIQQVQMANLMMMRMVFAAPITFIWAIVKIQASSLELTIATAVAIVLLMIAILSIMLTVFPKFKSMQKLTDKINGVTRENLTGIRVVRAYNAEKLQENKFDAANEKFTKTQIFTGRVMSLMSPVMMIIMNGISLAIYWIGAGLINGGKIDYATVTSFMMLSSQIIMAFVMLLMMFIMFPRACVSAGRINQVLDTNSSIVDPVEKTQLQTLGTIEFKNVTFKYPDGKNNVLENINFTAMSGQTVAFVGSTGSGKSTLVNLIPRLFDVTEGEILIDGINIKDVTQNDLRKKIGYVPQKAFLFKGSIRDNISLGVENLSQEELESSARIACAEDFILKKKEGYDFEIAQNGKNVSGGQKQRLSIARAVAIKPDVFIFDDSFSALDYSTDKKVRSNLNNLDYKPTKLIVAQRIGTIIEADKIIVLDNGKVVGEGTHQELLKTCEVYKEIALSQLSKKELGI